MKGYDKMKDIRMGIIGVGNMGSIHAANITAGKVSGMVLGGLCDISDEREKFCKEKYPDVAFFKDYKEMLKSGEIDAVIIAVPHYSHPPIAIDAFAANLHVITEKPAGVYTKQVIEMIEASKKTDKLFGIMYNQRTNTLYQKLRKMIQDGQLGGLKRVSWIITDWYRPQSYHDSSAWRSTWADEGGGTLINQNPHQLDLWQWMFGMPDKIMSHVSFGKYYNIEVEDDVTAFMQYDNGLTGTYITSTGEAPGTNRLEVNGDMGKIVIEKDPVTYKETMTFHRNVVSEREFNKTNTAPFGAPECWKCEIPIFQTGEQHVGILKNFVSAINNGTPLLAPGEDGIYGLTISNAIHYSAWTNGWADVKNFPHDEFYELLNERIKTSKKKTNVTAKVANLDGTY